MVIGQTYMYSPIQRESNYKTWHFGFSFGPELRDFIVDNNSESIITSSNNANIYIYSKVPKLSPAFHIGLITSRRLSDHFDVRIIPSFSLGQYDIESYYYSGDDMNTIAGSRISSIKSAYLGLPILIKYKIFRVKNMVPYLVGGSNFKYDLTTDFDQIITLKKLNETLELGVGSDFLMENFKLGMEVRFGVGLFNVLSERPEQEAFDNTYLTSSIDAIRTKTITIAINFE